eukprot:8281434-Ditylum_brightwellii.AAC.1
MSVGGAGMGGPGSGAGTQQTAVKVVEVSLLHFFEIVVHDKLHFVHHQAKFIVDIMLCRFAAPAVVESKQWDSIEFVQCDALGKLEVCDVMPVLNAGGVLVLFSLVNWMEIFEESGLDVFIGMKNE